MPYNIEDVPKIDYPKWLPADVRSVLEQYIKINSQESTHSFTSNDYLHIDFFKNLCATDPEAADEFFRSQPYSKTWNRFLENAEIMKHAFTDPCVQHVWESLYKVSPEKTVLFAKELLKFKTSFETKVENAWIDKDERERFTKITQKVNQLLVMLKEYEEYSYGHLTDDEHLPLVDALDRFLLNTHRPQYEFKLHIEESADLKKSYSALGRQYKNKQKAMPIFFTRRICEFFIAEFGNGRFADISNLICIMFDAQYDESRIRKIIKDTNDLIEHNNSKK